MTGPEMAELDRRAIREFGIPGLVLMETAGRAVFHAARTSWPEARSWAILCGPGNNGGDGFVIARTVLNHGGRARVGLVGSVSRLSGDCQRNYELLKRYGGEVEELSAETLESFFAGADLAVDALFGTGLARPVEGLAAQALEAFNRAEIPRVAVDIPSGVCSRTGRILGVAAEAVLTVTMGLPKAGLLLYPGSRCTGRLLVAEIGFPAGLLEEAGAGELVGPELVQAWLPERPANAHKGSCGHALLVAGSQRYPGAAFLATRAALRVGAGLVTLATPGCIRHLAVQQNPEALTVALACDQLEPSDLPTLREARKKGENAFGLGPGVGREPGTVEAIRLLARELQPLLLDAEGLRAIAGMTLLPRTVLTPHPGEMSALMDQGVPELEADRVATAQECAARYGCVVVFKGLPTVVAQPDGSYWIDPSGSSVLSQGGTGDVLSGAITGLLAQGLSPTRAAVCGVYLHGAAARLCARRIGPRGVSAGEIAGMLPLALKRALAGRGPRGAVTASS